MPRLVPDWCTHGLFADGHPCDRRLILIGEAPGKNEDQYGKPFCGASGFILDQWWEAVGLRRADFYITNVYRHRPPNNVIEAIPRADIAVAAEELHVRLAALEDPVVIVPTGNVALNALLPSREFLQITDYRGSILEYVDKKERRIKVIPTIHPAATFKQPILAKFCRADWGRIAADSCFKELRLPVRQHVCFPAESGTAFVSQFEADVRLAFEATDASCAANAAYSDSVPAALSIDIETIPESNEITCVGFAYTPEESLTISTRRCDYNADEDYRFAWNAIKRLCALPIPKVLQNGLFDLYHLWYHGVPVVNYKYDLMEMDHALNPNDGGDTEKGSEDASKDRTFKMEMRSLKILNSLYTREPYYKNEGKFSNHYDWMTFFRYNGKDACVTIEIYQVLYKLLRAAGLV